VLVTASDETRAQRVPEGAKQVRREDGNRADYLKRFYGVERELPTHFDLVINTDVLTPEKAADIIVAAAA
jgi:cytidylate kinase